MKLWVVVPLAALGIAAVAAPARSAAPSRPARAPEPVLLQSNLRDLYPAPADICLVTYQQMKDAPGVVLHLRTALEGFAHFRVTRQHDSLPAGPAAMERGPAITVRFAPDNPRPQRIVTTVEAVTRSGRRSRPFTIELGYVPSAHYAASGQKSPNWLVVHATDLARCGSSVEDWIVERATEAERAYARKRWGPLVRPHVSEYEQARAIARELVRALRPHDGIPSSAMRFAPPFEQLARAESGQDRVWCGNYADIFSAACNALDIPVRRINLQHVWSSEGKTAFEVAEGHRTTEVFDRELNRWIWMDLTFGHLGAREAGGDPLTMVEMVEALNDERRLERLELVEFDPERGVERTVPVTRSARGKELFRFFRDDQRYEYARTR